MSIDLRELANEITRTVREYTEDVIEKVEKAADERSKKAVKLLKQNSPKDTGEYAKSWGRVKKRGTYIIRNKKYQLTHLLEKGHAKFSGGRVPGTPHIAPVEEKIVEGFIRDVEEAIRG